jgi:hypothetical protein
LLDTVQHHASAEETSLAEYRELAERTSDPVVRLLVQLVLDDEARHHDLLARMAISLQDALSWTHSSDALPVVWAGDAPADPAFIATTQARIREEQEGARILHGLARKQVHVADGLFSLLLECMAMDSQKHERILRFIQKRLEHRP